MAANFSSGIPELANDLLLQFFLQTFRPTLMRKQISKNGSVTACFADDFPKITFLKMMFDVAASNLFATSFPVIGARDGCVRTHFAHVVRKFSQQHRFPHLLLQFILSCSSWSLNSFEGCASFPVNLVLQSGQCFSFSYCRRFIIQLLQNMCLQEQDTGFKNTF